jgi:serine phosphatase RsbU (regulator of sigma subunit)
VAVDYSALFAAAPSPSLVLTEGLIVCEVNRACLQMLGRTRHELIGRSVLDLARDAPADISPEALQRLEASLRRVLSSGRPDSIAFPHDEAPGMNETLRGRQESQPTLVSTPVLDQTGAAVLLLHWRDRFMHGDSDATSSDGSAAARRPAAPELDVAARAHDLQDANERLRAAHARERQIALSLQQAMLPTVADGLASLRTATRYRPAMESLNVCGDWYDITWLSDDHLAVAVGDVVGHGLVAAGVMGQLRAALVAATSATGRPDRALEVLDRYAHSIEAAVGTTVVKVVIDFARHTLSYSSAGHPPPLLLGVDGHLEHLDQATGPPLASSSVPLARTIAETTFRAGDILALCTDGLIERRGESIAEGIARFGAALARHCGGGIEPAADAILAELVGDGAAADDVALVLVAL